MKLKKKIPNGSFTVIIQPPFVVIGDESPAMVKRRAEGTVKWSVDRLKAAYFTKDPKEILAIEIGLAKNNLAAIRSVDPEAVLFTNSWTFLATVFSR